MLIPRYWAEARRQEKRAGKQVTVRHFGWSDTSQAEAQDMADHRAGETVRKILNGETLLRREPVAPYGTETGLPIREEVVSRHGDSVVTRNSYGSLCLNTPDVFFADVDTVWNPKLTLGPGGCLGLVALGAGAGVSLESIPLGLGLIIGLPWLCHGLISLVNRGRRAEEEKRMRREALERIRGFSRSHPDWHLRVYETPAGYRLMALHDVFDPKGEAARSAMEEMNSDRRFVTLCRLQSCFRARVSPKPWRVGYRPEVSLPKGKYPFPPEVVAKRKTWCDGYGRAAQGHASCRFLERLGSERAHPRAEKVRALHDDLCRALDTLPLA